MKEREERKVFIYSGQWGAFWRSNCEGYTTNRNEAGVYTFREAFNNTSHCGEEKRIFFETVNP